MNAFFRYINDAVSELKHVRWPTRQQAIRLSLIVIGFCFVMAIIFGALDFGLSMLMKFLLSLTY